MKKAIKTLVTLLCTAAMIIGICSTAFAAEGDYDLETVYAMAQKALDQQAIQNVMSRHVMYHCYGLHREEMEEIWVQEPENQATASFGQNQGFYVGYEAIWEAYVEGHDTSWLKTAKSYCEKQGIDIEGWTDEEILDVYGGVGQLLLHVTTTAIIEVAEDGQTAKCFWYSPGMICETGQSGNTIWEAYGVDFVKEGGEWKMWHLHMFTDFMGSFYMTLGGNSGGSGGGQGGGAGAQDAAPADDGESAGGEGGESAGEEAPAEGGESAGEAAEPSGESAGEEAAAAEGESAGEEGESAGDGETPPEKPTNENGEPDTPPDGYAGGDGSAPAPAEQQEWQGEGGAQVAAASANDYLYSTQYYEFSSSRLRSDMEIFIPTAYESWDFADENYGPTKEEFESYGIDLEAWYAAH